MIQYLLFGGGKPRPVCLVCCLPERLLTLLGKYESREKRLGGRLGLFQEDREEGDYFVLKGLKTSL